MNLNTFRKVMAAAINLMRQRKPVTLTAEYQVGYHAGREWAMFWKNPVELECISRLVGRDIDTADNGDAGTWLAVQMTEALGFNPDGPHAVYRARCVLFSYPDGLYSREYVCGYLAGAEEGRKGRTSTARK